MRAAFSDLSGRAWACICLTVLAPAMPAVGQLYAPGGVVPNPYAPPGYVQRNPIVQRFTANLTNPYVTGNVTGGMSFRGFSPIRDASSLFLSVPSNFGATSTFGSSTVLPSDRLSYFVRDSYNLADQQSRRQMSTYIPGSGYTPWSSYNQALPYAGRPYYPQQSTVASTGAIIQGLNRPGTSQMLSPYLPPQSDARALRGLGTTGGSRLEPSSWSVPDQLVRADTGRAITGYVNPRLLNSSLFGSAVRQVPLDALAAQAAHDQSFGQPAVGPLDLRVMREPLDLRANQQPTGQRGLGQPQSPSPLERLLGGQFAAQQRAAQGLPGGGQPGAPGAGTGPPSGVPGPGEQPGDLFGHLQAMVGSTPPTPLLAGSPLWEPNVPSEVVVPPGEEPPLANPPSGAGPFGGPAGASRTPPGAPNAIMPPLKSFVGTEQTVVNAYLADAEVQLKAGQYYRASAVYDLARSVDPGNPLAVLGRSMALLAAGDYLTSATDMFHAIRLFESLAQFRIDLKAFVPDLEVLDRRRADLERRLEAHDDFRLRFLLGYAEYCSDLEQAGLANMTKAAQSVPPEMDAVKRFVETIQKRTQGQPQGTPPTTQPVEIPPDVLGPADSPK